MACFVHPQAQKLLIAMKGAGYTPRAKDIVCAHRFTVNTHMNVKNGANTYVPINTKCAGLYPFIGNSTVSQGFNLVNIGNSGATNKYLNFVGTPIPNDGSMPWNGSSQYADTFIDSSVYAGATNFHMTYYSLSAGIAGSTGSYDIGTGQNFLNYYYFQCRRNGTQSAAIVCSPVFALSTTGGVSNGVFTTVRAASTTHVNCYLNGGVADVQPAALNIVDPVVGNFNLSRALFTDASNGSKGNKTCAGAVIGALNISLTATEVASQYNAWADLNARK